MREAEEDSWFYLTDDRIGHRSTQQPPVGREEGKAREVTPSPEHVVAEYHPADPRKPRYRVDLKWRRFPEMGWAPLWHVRYLWHAKILHGLNRLTRDHSRIVSLGGEQ